MWHVLHYIEWRAWTWKKLVRLYFLSSFLPAPDFEPNIHDLTLEYICSPSRPDFDLSVELNEDMKVTLSSPEPETPQSCNGQKRTVSEAGLDPSDARGSRKRAAKACQSCRSRKVRCSVSDHGVPCYNCKLDELECVIPERKRPARTAKRE